MFETMVDRVREREFVKDFIKQPQTHPQIQIFSTQPHSGLSHFLKHCSGRNYKQFILLYADGAQHEGNSLFAQLGIELFRKYKNIWRAFVRSQESHAGRSRTREASAAISESLPYIGRAVSKGIDLHYPTLSLSSYPSVAAELLCEFFVELSKNYEICLFIDNIQEIDDWSGQLLSSTVGRAYKQIRYIAGFVMREKISPNALDDFAMKSKDVGYGVSSQFFSQPDEEFIYHYAQAAELYWSLDHCAVIAAATRGDIYRIRAAIAASNRANSESYKPIREFNSLERFIVMLLALACQNLRFSDILALCLGDITVFVENEVSISKGIEKLVLAGYVSKIALPDGDFLITLQVSSSSVLEDLQNTSVETLRLEGVLYEYFSRVKLHSKRHSEAEIAPLLYRLAKRIDSKNLNLRVGEIIRLSLQMGSRSAAEEFVNKAIDSTNHDSLTFQDYLAKLAFFVSIKHFDRVLELTENPPNSTWSKLRPVQLFNGISLNRCRQHRKSEQILASLAMNPSSLEELVILISYRIVGQIHDNNVSEAKKLFLEYSDRLSTASNYGYFLRNGSEVCEESKSIEVLNDALEYHKRNKDTFGYATTLCNRGAKRAQIGFPDEGLRDVEEAYELLEIFGVHHLHIATGNLAHCLLYLEMFELAEQACLKALRYMNNDLPRIYTLLNLASAHLFQGSKSRSLELVRQVTLASEKVHVDRVRQKAYLNGALIALCSNAPSSYVNLLCQKALEHPDRWNPSMTVERIEKISNMSREKVQPSKKEFFDLYSPCSLLYWYLNPLEGLPSNFLSPETMH